MNAARFKFGRIFSGGAVCAARWMVWLGAGIVLLALLVVPALGRDAPPQVAVWIGGVPPGVSASQQTRQPAIEHGDNDAYNGALRRSQLKAARQQALIGDTNKLLKVAAELNAEVGGANAGALTRQHLRMAAEIERLARNVERNMKTSLSLNPDGPSVSSAPHPGGNSALPVRN